MDDAHEDWMDALEALLEPLARLTRDLERDLITVESLRPVHQVRNPSPERLHESLRRARLMPVREKPGRAHILTATGQNVVARGFQAEKADILGFQLMDMLERQTVSTTDIAPNRVLSQSLRRVSHILGRKIRDSETSPPVRVKMQRLRQRLRALHHQGFGQEPVGLMRPADLLHRGLRAKRYQVVKQLWDLLRRAP